MAELGLALIVDDHPTNRILASTLLRKLGWTTEDVESGEAALRLMEEKDFALVLLDISMPGLSGEETCQRMRQTTAGKNIRIIAYTAHAFPEDRARFLATGFDDILVKPINRQQFEALLAK